jgi:hypothetical protein
LASESESRPARLQGKRSACQTKEADNRCGCPTIRNRPCCDDLGAHLAAKIDVPGLSGMFNFGAANLIGGFVFSSIGLVAFIHGKRMHLWKPIFCGLALMIFPYFIANTATMYVMGITGTAILFFLRE